MNVVTETRELKRAAFTLQADNDEPEGREISLSFSSEEPYLREDGWEILGHRTGEVDLSRLASGEAPLLKDHKPTLDSMVGLVVKAQIRGGRGIAVVRFSETAEGDKLLARVRAGEVRCVSVGYAVHDRMHAGERDGLPVFRVTRWVPKEISLVAIPADATVGVGRSDSAGRLQTIKQKGPKVTDPVETEQYNEPRTPVEEERHRAAEIMAIGEHFDLPREMVQAAVNKGTKLHRFRERVLGFIEKRQNEERDNYQVEIVEDGLGAPSYINRSGARPYSLTRALNAHLTHDWSEAGFEKEVAQEMKRVMGRSPEGIYVPEVALAKRDLLTTSNASSLIGTEHAGNAFIDALRPEAQVLGLGATVLPGLRQDVSIPKMPVGTSAEWIAEDAEANESTPTFESVTLSLRQLSAHTRMSRKQLKQSVPGLDVILQNDLRQQIAVAVDRAAIAGAGGANEPQGILGMTGIGNVPLGTDGGPITWAAVTELMASVESENVPMQSLGFLSNAKVKGALLSTPKFSGGDTPILTAEKDGYAIAGSVAAFTTNVPANLTKGSGTDLSALIFGSWGELIIGQWGGIDIILDEMTEATRGNVRIVAHSEWDISVRHSEAFAAIQDISTQ